MYSSPPGGGFSSGAPSPHSTTMAGPTTKMMQVKVLYSFDDDNKTNCLARCPQPLQVQTAFVDHATQIGIIELRACIEAILEGSPELTNKLDRDFTVYAYDYSEYETPLVGQGMLSRILHSTSPTPDAPAELSQTMVTGRVCKNMMGLFQSGGLGETLEVKLRLVPVPKSVENQYQDYMQKYRDANLHAAQTFNGDNWSDFLRANPGIGVPSPSASSTIVDHPTMQMQAYSQSVHSPGNASHDARSPFSHNNPMTWDASQNAALQMAASSRPATPQQQPQPSSLHQQRQPLSRPSSRTSVRSSAGTTSAPALRRQSTTMSSMEDSHQSQEPNFYQDGARKRARVEQTDWRGPSAFGSKRDSLRIAASTAASIRSQGPAPSDPHAADLVAGEIGPRPPTPIGNRTLRKNLPRTRDRASYASPYTFDADNLESSLSMASSPPRIQRADSIMSTPFDMPSSPPIGPDCSNSLPSSPQLPPLVDVDSGFASGNFDEDMATIDDETRPLNDDDYQQASQFAGRRSGNGAAKSRPKPRTKKPSAQDLTSEMNITTEMPGDPNLLPTKILPRPQKPPPAAPRKKTKSGVATPVPSSPKLPALLPPESNNDANVQPSQPVSYREPSAPRPSTADSRSQSRPRSMSISKQPSEAPGGSGRSQNWKSIRRKEIILENLRQAIAAGQAPRFCANCGDVETPCWRKCFITVQPGPLNDEIIAAYKEPGCCVVPGDPDPVTSLVTTHRIIKRSVSEEEKEPLGFTADQLCNPCGIHFYKYDRMRVVDKLDKDKPDESGKASQRKRKRTKKSAGDAEPLSAPAGPESEMDTPYPMSDFPSGRSDKSVAKSTGRGNRSQPNSGRSDRSEPKRVSGTHRGNNLARTMSDPTIPASSFEDHAVLLQRAIQSSPPRLPGSKNSPIEIDDDHKSPNPTRRLLFPSPRRAGHMKTLDGFQKTGGPVATPATPSRTMDDPFNNMAAGNLDVDFDKENVPPAGLGGEDLSYLFEGPPFKKQKTPKTPKTTMTPRSGSGHSDPFKTPSRSSTKILRGILTSAARAYKNANAEMPSRAMVLEGMDHSDMTPSTRRLTSLITGGDEFGGDLSDLGGFDFGAGGSLIDVFDDEQWAQVTEAMNDYFPEQHAGGVGLLDAGIEPREAGEANGTTNAV